MHGTLFLSSSSIHSPVVRVCVTSPIIAYSSSMRWLRSCRLMFQDELRELVERAEGAVASLLMGFDGITVDSYSRGGGGLNVESIGSEYSVVLGQIKQAASMSRPDSSSGCARAA